MEKNCSVVQEEKTRVGEGSSPGRLERRLHLVVLQLVSSNSGCAEKGAAALGGDWCKPLLPVEHEECARWLTKVWLHAAGLWLEERVKPAMNKSTGLGVFCLVSMIAIKIII